MDENNIFDFYKYFITRLLYLRSTTIYFNAIQCNIILYLAVFPVVLTVARL